MLTFDAEGLDIEAQKIIGPRRRELLVFFEQVLESHIRDGFDVHQDASVIPHLFLPLEPSVDVEAYLRLAQSLGFVDAIRRRNYLRFWRSGMLSQSIWPSFAQASRDQNTIATTIADIERRFRAVIESSEHVTDWIGILSQQGLCRDEAAARQIAYNLDRIDGMACTLARDLVLTWCRIGVLGLLKHSHYACFDELMVLHRHEPGVIERRQDGAALIATLRSDLIALYHAFHYPDFVKAYQASYGDDARAWDQSLLHIPPGAEARKRAQDGIAPLKHILVPVVVATRGCDAVIADRLLSALLECGLSGLIVLRCSDGDTSRGSSAEHEQIRKAAGQLLKPISAAKREQILARLVNLHDSAIASGESFPLSNLIRHLPSSAYRRKRQRRKVPEALLTEFASREHIRTSTAESYLKNLMIYGPLGLLPKREWRQAMHPRLWSYLHLFKLGRLEDTISESVVTECVNIYAKMLGVEPVPKQIVISILRHFPKPSYYNSGDGKAIAGVPLRKALKLAGVARLHEQWILLPIELGIDLVSPALHSLSGDCWIMLVLDCGSQRPVGFWVSEKKPTSVDAGLALYDAIFHPGAPHWPLRGIPEHILVPAELEERGIENVRQSATFLMAQVEVMPDHEQLLAKLSFARKLIKDLIAEHAPAGLPGRRRAPKVQMTIRQAEEAINKWLYQRCFGDEHRTDPVIKELRQRGVALPGYDTPAAGYLLPVITETMTERDGVTISRRFYADPMAGIEPGVPVRVRFPPARLGATRGIFIEYGSEQIMHYLPLHTSADKRW